VLQSFLIFLKKFIAFFVRCDSSLIRIVIRSFWYHSDRLALAHLLTPQSPSDTANPSRTRLTTIHTSIFLTFFCKKQCHIVRHATHLIRIVIRSFLHHYHRLALAHLLTPQPRSDTANPSRSAATIDLDQESESQLLERRTQRLSARQAQAARDTDRWEESRMGHGGLGGCVAQWLWLWLGGSGWLAVAVAQCGSNETKMSEIE
jgi:hypothetical protein